MTDAELAEARLTALLDAERENTALRAELDRTEHTRSSLDTALMLERERERAAVVAWLEELSASSLHHNPVAELQYAARSIKRGEHRREEEK